MSTIPATIQPSCSAVAERNKHMSELYYQWIGKRVRTKVRPYTRHTMLATQVTGTVIGVDPRPMLQKDGDWLYIRLDPEFAEQEPSCFALASDVEEIK